MPNESGEVQLRLQPNVDIEHQAAREVDEEIFAKIDQNYLKGTKGWWEARTKAVKWLEDKNEGVIPGSVDYLTKAEEKAAAEDKSRIDGKTGLMNQRGLCQELRKKFEIILREPELYADIYILLVKPDIVGFKAFNDLMGWEIGDEVLALYGQAFVGGSDGGRKIFRASDIVSNVGGDDFGLVFEMNKKDILEEDAASVILSKVKDLGISVKRKLNPEYVGKFDEAPVEKRLGALRLPENYEGLLTWNDTGVGALRVPAVLLSACELANQYKLLRKSGMSEEKIWSHLISPYLDEPTQKSKDPDPLVVEIFLDDKSGISKLKLPQ
jgi:diguanylate cyclase (GGDEF)-like protein